MAKKKLKKLLKRALPLAALAAGAGMLARRNQMRDFLATEGGDRSNMFTKPNMLDIAGSVIKPKIKRGSVLADPKINKMDTSEVDIDFVPGVSKRISGQSVIADPRLNTGAFDIFKDGGRVVKTGEKASKRKKKIGIQIRGFGKARK